MMYCTLLVGWCAGVVIVVVRLLLLLRGWGLREEGREGGRGGEGRGGGAWSGAAHLLYPSDYTHKLLNYYYTCIFFISIHALVCNPINIIELV